MGAEMIREAATSDQASDSTTTATVLAHAIVRDRVEVRRRPEAKVGHPWRVPRSVLFLR
jgi:hypothetical protein